jgi:hypothetical protein
MYRTRDLNSGLLCTFLCLLIALATGCGGASPRQDPPSQPRPDQSKVVFSGGSWVVTKNGTTMGTYDAARTAYSVSYDWAASQFRLTALSLPIYGGDDTLAPADFALLATRTADKLQLILAGATTAQAYPQEACLPLTIYSANGSPAYARAANPAAPMTIDPNHWQPGPAQYDPTATPGLTLSDTTYIGPLTCATGGGLLDGYNPCVVASRDGNDIIVVIISTIIDPQHDGPIRMPDAPGELGEVRGKVAAADAALTQSCQLGLPPANGVALYSGPISTTRLKLMCKSLLHIEQEGACKAVLDLSACGVWVIIGGDQVIVTANCSPQALACSNF